MGRGPGRRLIADASSHDPEALLSLGIAQQKAGRHAEAIAAFERARAAIAQDPRPPLFAASSLLALDRGGAALEAAARACALAPERPDAHLVYAEIAQALGATERAETAFETAIHLAPRSPKLWLRRAAARRRVGDRDRALSDVDEALRLDPADAEAKAVRGALLAPPRFAAWRPTSPAAALGLAVEYLGAKPAFAALPFGEWSQTLFWQTARRHYVFVVDAEQRVAGFLGWALTGEALAEAWVEGRQGLSNDQCLEGDCVIVNAWATDGEAAQSFLREAAARLFAARRALYFKRHYPDGRERAIRLPIPRHRRAP